MKRIIISNSDSSKMPSQKKNGESFVYVTEGKPKEGDWFICTNIDNPTPAECGGENQTGYRFAYCTNEYTHDKENYEKIVSTNDPRLLSANVPPLFKQPKFVPEIGKDLVPIDETQIPGYEVPVVFVKDGKFDVLIDNEYCTIPVFVHVKASKENEVVGDNGERVDTTGMHTIENELLRGVIAKIYEDGEDINTLSTHFIYPDIEGECDKILAIVEKYQDVLCKNRPALAYIMARWQNMFYAGRICFGYRGCLNIAELGQCENNPKYEFEDMFDEDNEDVIYDAWACDPTYPLEFRERMEWVRGERYQMSESDFTELGKMETGGEFMDLLNKKNKTMDDWYNLLGDPRYTYHSLYTTKQAIDDHLLCTIGNGYDWNKDGYLCNNGPSGEDESDYGMYVCMKGNFPESIRHIEAELDRILLQEHVQMVQELAKKWWFNEQLNQIRKDLRINKKVGDFVFSVVFEGQLKRKLEVNMTDKMREIVKNEHSKFAQDLTSAFLSIETKKQQFISENGDPADNPHLKEKYEALFGDMQELKKINNIIEEITEKSTKLILDSMTDDDVLNMKKIEDAELESYMNSRLSKEKNRAGRYYPISRSSRLMKMPKNVHPSYLAAAKKIMLDIVNNLNLDSIENDNERLRHHENLEQARVWLGRHGEKEYQKYIPEKIDKEEIFNRLNDIMSRTDKHFPNVEGRLNQHGAPKPGEKMFYRVDREESEYSYDEIFGYFSLDKKDESYPVTISNDVSVLQGTLIYEDIKAVLSAAALIPEIKSSEFYYENIEDHSRHIFIKFSMESKQEQYNKECITSDAEFVSKGFMIGHNIMALETEKYILVTSKSKTLGSKHPNNVSGKEYYSNAQFFDVYDKNWTKQGSFQIDERKYNIFRGHSNNKELNDWLFAQHKAMKASDPDYGTYQSELRNNKDEGKKSLYAHDFMLWLRDGN